MFQRFRAGADRGALFAEFVKAAAEAGPKAMREQARSVGAPDPDGNEFFTRAFLQPWAEAAFPEPQPGAGGGILTRCPCCSREPVAAALRAEGHGARRGLVCPLCGWECGSTNCRCFGPRSFRECGWRRARPAAEGFTRWRGNLFV